MATKKQEAKVIIGLPCTDIVRARSAHAIGCAVIGAKGLVFDFILRQSCDIVSSRTLIVKDAIKKGATHLLFVDSDISFPNDTISKMLTHDKDIVGARYHKRQFPLEWTHQLLADIPESETELHQVRFVGAGLMLIKLSIFENMQTPWFNFGRDKEGALAIGEDAWFCQTARDSGYLTWIDPTISVGHVGEYQY